jgi:hypothetical protein
MKLSALILDPSAQPRVTLDAKLIDEYAEAIGRGETFPPITAYGTERRAFLADGWHRYHATQVAGLTEIAAEIKPGNLDDAVWHSVTANAAHGLRRSNADKQRAVTTALTLRPTLADTEIARHCAVDHGTVATIRKRLEGAGTIGAAPVREHTRKGGSVQQRVREPQVRPAPKPGTSPTRRRSAPPEPVNTQDAAPPAPAPALENGPIDKEGAMVGIFRIQRLLLWTDVQEWVTMTRTREDRLTVETARALSQWFGVRADALAQEEDENP